MKIRLLTLFLIWIWCVLFFASCARQSGAPAVKVNFDTRVEWKKAFKAKFRELSKDENFKQRFPEKAWDWFYSRRMGGKTGFIPVDYREVALRHTERFCQPVRGLAADADWRPLGPYPPRGRIKDICVHPQNENVIYVGSASGGVWKTTDQGLNWVNLTDNKISSLGIGSLIMNPSDPNNLYAGLGEGLAGKIYEPLGTGVYRTNDGGVNWTLTPGSGNNAMQVTVDLRFGANSQTLFAACLGVKYGYSYQGHGLFMTTDGGNTWVKKMAQRCWSISVDPSNANNLVVTTEESDHAWIYYSTDGGNNFTRAAIPNDTTSKRIEIDRCKNQPQNLFALVGSSGPLSGIWKSTDGGKNWTVCALDGIPMTDDNEKPGQMYYNNCIAVVPNDPNTVYIGTNLRAYKTTNGGTNWNSIAYWWVPNQLNLPYIHADHHGIAFGASPSTVYYATDGGFFVSKDSGKTWLERNNNLLCTQIYRNANSATIENKLMIGCQDNSVYVTNQNGNWSYIPWFGDGFECIIDRDVPNYVYSTNYYGSNVLFSNAGGETQDAWYYLRDPQGGNGIPANEMGAWVVPFVADPLDPTMLYLGLANIYRTQISRKPSNENPGLPTWTKIYTGAGGTKYMEVMRLSYGPTNRKVFFIQSGLSEAVSLFRMNLDGTSVELLKQPRVGFINDIACDPNNNSNVWICYSDIFSYPSEKSRIYKSTDMGNTWQDKTSNLPKTLPVSAIFIDPDNTNTIIIGTDLGCYRSDDDGASWYQFNNGFANVVVTDLAYFPAGRKLRAATYGRGMWETPLTSAGTPDIKLEPNFVQFP